MDDFWGGAARRGGVLSAVSVIHRRRGWAFWVGLAISLGCVVWASFSLDWRQIMAALRQADWVWLLFAVVAVLLRIATRAARWRSLFVLVALTGNSIDLRLLRVLVEELHARGYRDLIVADAPNFGVRRKGIDALHRLAVDRLVVLCHVRARDLTSNWALGPGFLVGLLQLPLARRAGAHEVLSSPP